MRKKWTKLLPNRKKEDLKEYKQFVHLKGEQISISDAARKYDVPLTTLSGWAKKRNLITRTSDGYRVFLNEQDVAYCVSVYKKRKGQGKRIFYRDGTPYQTKVELKT